MLNVSEQALEKQVEQFIENDHDTRHYADEMQLLDFLGYGNLPR